jgi:hypothetical protein
MDQRLSTERLLVDRVHARGRARPSDLVFCKTPAEPVMSEYAILVDAILFIDGND